VSGFTHFTRVRDALRETVYVGVMPRVTAAKHRLGTLLVTIHPEDR
jgi:hypothetical protein